MKNELNETRGRWTGAVLEPGPATATAGVWSCVTKTARPASQQVSIEVTATDRPGHKTTKTQTKG